jgi:ComF family protein
MDIPIRHYPMKLWRTVLDTLVPSQCLACRAPAGEPASLCVACWGKLKQIDDPVCDMMGTPFAYDQGPGSLSPAALADPASWDRARAPVLFEDTAQGLVHALKYQDRQEAGLLMARMMARAGRGLLAEADLIVPVPLHRWRLWGRRFNQSGFLALQLARHAGKPYRPELLQRAKRTTSQVGLDREARRRNVRGAFVVDPEKASEIAGKAVLLVDDVRTTGATAEACAVTLKKAGARTVGLLSFALVPGPARGHI